MRGDESPRNLVKFKELMCLEVTCQQPAGSPTSILAGADGKPANYWIPAYQRGYRWSPLQVTQLLDDLWEFIQAGAGNSDGGRRRFGSGAQGEARFNGTLNQATLS